MIYCIVIYFEKYSKYILINIIKHNRIKVLDIGHLFRFIHVIIEILFGNVKSRKLLNFERSLALTDFFKFRILDSE